MYSTVIKHPCISGLGQFKPVLFKSQLYFTFLSTVNWQYYLAFHKRAGRNLLV